MYFDQNIVELVVYVLFSLVALLLVGTILYYSYLVIRHNERNDKTGFWIWLRRLSQLLALTPFFVTAMFVGVVGSTVVSESFAEGCTSGPGMGPCFGLMFVLGISMYLGTAATIISFILYKVSTKSKVSKITPKL
jgi:hypothetical protein